MFLIPNMSDSTVPVQRLIGMDFMQDFMLFQSSFSSCRPKISYKCIFCHKSVMSAFHNPGHLKLMSAIVHCYG